MDIHWSVYAAANKPYLNKKYNIKDVLSYIDKYTEDICIEIVRQNGKMLMYIKNQTEKMCIEAVKENYKSLKYVKEQSERICKEALKQNHKAKEYVKIAIDDCI